jgi:hypothetical protein
MLEISIFHVSDLFLVRSLIKMLAQVGIFNLSHQLYDLKRGNTNTLRSIPQSVFCKWMAFHLELHDYIPAESIKGY